MDIKNQPHDRREPQPYVAKDEDRRADDDDRERIIVALNAAFERDFHELFERDRAA